MKINNLSSGNKSKIGFALGIFTGFLFLLGVFSTLADPELLPCLAALWGTAWLAAQIPLVISMRRQRQREVCVKHQE